MLGRGILVVLVAAAVVGVAYFTAARVKQQQAAARAAAEPAEATQESGLVGMEQPPARVGEIYVLGNHHTPMDVILEQVPLRPGQVLSYPDLQQAQKRLEESGLFVVDPARGIRPSIEVIEGGEGSVFRNILIHVYEKTS